MNIDELDKPIVVKVEYPLKQGLKQFLTPSTTAGVNFTLK